MSIFEDAREGNLTGSKLDEYIDYSSPSILNQQDPSTGWTPLATAVIAGFPEEVEQLLKKGAQADGLSKDGETPLLLAAWKTTKERPLITQLLLAKTPSTSVDTTCKAAENKTPLMFAIENKDLDSIRLLRKAGASLGIKNDDGFNAREMALDTKNGAIFLALNPALELGSWEKRAAIVLSVLLYIAAWVNVALNGVVREASGLNPALDQGINQTVMGSIEPSEPNKDEFLERVDTFVKDNPVLERFFGDKKDFIQVMAQKAANLKDDPNTDLGNEELLPKTVKVSMHQQVIYCDDSTSMKREGRWDNQKKLISRIAKVTTLILPDGEGVALRFINREVDNSSNLTLDGIGEIMDPMPWQPGGNTDIGTNLRSKILEPLVYNKINTGSLDRPLLISIMTDGMPEPEAKSVLVNAILECGTKLQEADYPRESVKFMIGQIGVAKGATDFLRSLKDNTDIDDVAFVVSDKLDEEFAKFHGNDRGLDRWLIESLFSPFDKGA